MRPSWLVPVFCAVACAPGVPIGSHPEPSPPEIGGQSGSDPGGACIEDVAIGSTGDVLEGIDGPFSAADLLGLATDRFAGTLLWQDGPPSALELVVDDPGEIRLVTATPGEDCTSRIEIDVRIGFHTDDGQLDEVADTVLFGVDPTTAWLDVDRDADALVGSYAFPEDGRIWTLRLSARVDAAGAHGTLSATSRGDATGGGVATGSESAGTLGTFDALR